MRYTPLTVASIEGIEKLATKMVKMPLWGGGWHYWVYFPNGFGASIIKKYGSYGEEEDLFEVAVIDHNNELIYTTPLTDDVFGFLTDEEVVNICKRIAELPADKVKEDME